MSDERPLYRGILGAGAAILVIAGLKSAAAILEPIAFALFLAVLAFPLFDWMRSHRVPLAVSVAATLVALCAMIVGFVLLVLGSLGEIRSVGPHYYQEIQARLAFTVDWWRGKGVDIVEWIPASLKDPQAILTIAGGTLYGLFRFLSQATIALLTVVFLLFEFAVFPTKLATAPPFVAEIASRFRNVSGELRRYLWIKTLMSMVVGLTVGLWVTALRLDFPVLLGLIAFAAHFIPNVGAILAAAPAMLIAFAQFDLMKAVVVAIGYFAIATVLGSLVEPALLGRRLGLSPLVVFLSLLFWGWLWGPVGMFLSVPLTMAGKILLASGPKTAWVAALLDVAPSSVAGDVAVIAAAQEAK